MSTGMSERAAERRGELEGKGQPRRARAIREES